MLSLLVVKGYGQSQKNIKIKNNPIINMENTEKNKKIFDMPFLKIYKCYILKAERKNRKKSEIDEIILWLTGYKEKDLDKIIKNNTNIKTFILKSPKLNPLRNLIKGSICGIKINEIKEPLIKEIRILDKLVDELSKGKTLDVIKN